MESFYAFMVHSGRLPYSYLHSSVLLAAFFGLVVGDGSGVAVAFNGYERRTYAAAYKEGLHALGTAE